MHANRNTAGKIKYMYVLVILLISCIIPSYCQATPSIEKIKQDFRDRDWEVRLGVIERLAGAKDKETVDFLMAVAGNKNEHWEVQIRAIRFLGDIRNPKAAPLLLSIFNSRSKQYSCPAIKLYTALALAGFGGHNDVIPSLITGTQSDEPLVREAAVQALGKIGDRSAVPSLTGLLTSTSIAVRLSAIKALENIGDPQAIPALEAIAKNDSDRVVRDTARIVLSNMQRI
jgi:HEAT repeat protein